ncbi:MAG: DUF3108 domain-containing protein [Candidatus Zixiibacteriota bacterium]|nr:MAG: DUF3108 domain-containing protein [candidate division Zixibacteria bacterium]
MRYDSKKRYSDCLFLLAVLLTAAVPKSAFGENPAEIVNPPLYLVYDVTYAGGKIAEVDFTESRPYSYKGQTVRDLECRIESSGLFNLNGRYLSIVADDYSVIYFRSDEGRPGDKRIVEYRLDYQNQSAAVIDNRVKGADTISTTSHIDNIDKKYFDTVSMIFKIRQEIGSIKAPYYIPLFMGGRQDSILIESISDAQSIGRNGEAVDAFLIKAKLPYSPYPGFGDGIEIYISKDEDRVPLRGRIQMALGYMEINLRPR